MDDNRLIALKAALENDPEDSFSRYALGLEYHSASFLRNPEPSLKN